MSEVTGPMSYGCLKAAGADTLGPDAKTIFISPSGVTETMAPNDAARIFTSRQGATSVIVAGANGSVGAVGDTKDSPGVITTVAALGTRDVVLGEKLASKAVDVFDTFVNNKRYHQACFKP